MRIFDKSVVQISVGIIAFIALTYSYTSRGWSEDIVILKSSCLLLWIGSLTLYQLYSTEFIKKYSGGIVTAFSAVYGLIMMAGLYIMSWKPDNYERSDLIISMLGFVLFTYLQHGMLKKKIAEQTKLTNEA